ncbi:hypothetical protein [Microbulbifer celer]|uniref:Uncharacterized protein n=1 Tax=Microbulbifer celer TaxID=435905 RepID=A0ABW3UD62_9GAMM|nr:hypothetical protein [Microbulbifer celer]UFN58219.1 hypothetical protein LPW13_04015 [Microbulbifer celer]
MDNDAYRLGLKSYARNRGNYKNPYPRSDSRHNDFERGWTQGLKRMPESVANEFSRQNYRAEMEKMAELKRERERVKDAYLKRKG